MALTQSGDTKNSSIQPLVQLKISEKSSGQLPPLVFTALGFAVASRAGFFNVGLSGQALVGWVFAGWFALANPDMPRPLLILATVIIAMLAGGIAGAILDFYEPSLVPVKLS